MSFYLGFGPLTMQRGGSEDRENEQLWADAIELAQRAELGGFASVWVGEHHFTSDGYLSAVFPFLGALSVATERVMLGTKVVLAPLHHPIRVAEDAAAVQLLSRGRLILGAAVGYRQEEFDGFGVSLTERAKRTRRLVEVARAAWSGDPVQVLPAPAPSITISPVPGHIPIWLGGAAPAALKRAGEIADGYVAPIGTPEDLISRLQVVDEAARSLGREVPAVASSSFVVLRDRSLNSDGVRAGLENLLNFYSAHKANDPSSRVGRLSDSLPAVIEGSVEEVIRRIQGFKDAVQPGRLHHHVVRLEYPGMTHQESLAHLDAFAKVVLPQLQIDTPGGGSTSGSVSA